jgi:hypothetical protein
MATAPRTGGVIELSAITGRNYIQVHDRDGQDRRGGQRDFARQGLTRRWDSPGVARGLDGQMRESARPESVQEISKRTCQEQGDGSARQDPAAVLPESVEQRSQTGESEQGTHPVHETSLWCFG